MAIDLLGPLDVRVDGAPVPTGGARQRAVLALLALSVGVAVPPARMIESLWDGDPAPTAANTVQVYMSRWRRQMAGPGGRTPLRTVTGMYLLDLPPEAVDARRFETLAEQGRDLMRAGNPRGAAERLHTALALWRSDELPDFAVSATGHAQFARLEALRLAALADRIDADALLGRHAELVPELQGLVLRHPLDERFVAQLMTSLYCDGQQAEALAAYAATADRLVEELGVDPGPALRALHGRVLRQDGALVTTSSWVSGPGALAVVTPVAAIPPQPGPPQPGLPHPGPAQPGPDGRRDAAGSPPSSSMPVVKEPTGRAIPAQGASAPSTPAPPVDPLVGRRAELTAALELLRRPGVRLVTVLGPGGAGKTRLAVEIARLRACDRSLRVAFVPLATVTRPAAMLREICRVIGAEADYAGEPVLDVAVRELTGGPVLLVLDNLEQFVDAGLEPIEQLLERVRTLTVLTTSRSVLRLAGEKLLLLGPLPLPETDGDDLASVLSSDAVRLFRERARAVLPTFEVGESNAAAVAALCRALDGLPLALELAAARVRVLPPDEILRRLDRRLELLAGGAPYLPERQQSMWAALDWSARLLDPAELLVFGQLSVFVGGWSLDAAEAVCEPGAPVGGPPVGGPVVGGPVVGGPVVGGPADVEPVVDVLGRLADKSLVVADGTGRLGMLETVRDYAREVLAGQPRVEAATRDRHAHHYAELAERLGPQSRGWLSTTGSSPRAALDREAGNLAAALRHAAGEDDGPGDGDLLGRLVAGLLDHWFGAGRVRMADRWLQAARQAQMSPALRARLLLSFGNLAVIRGDLLIAVDALAEATEAATRFGDTALVVRAYAARAVAARYLGHSEEAFGYLATALERLAGDDSLPAVDAVGLERALENELGEVLDDLDRTDEAIALWQECRRWAAAADNPGQLAYPLVNLARSALEAGRPAIAEEVINEALAAAEAAECVPVLADVVAAAGLIDLRAGHRVRAVARLRRAVQLAHDCGQLLSLPELVSALGAGLLEEDAAVATRLLAAGRAWRRSRAIALVGRAARAVVPPAEAAPVPGLDDAQLLLERGRGERTPFGSMRGLTMLDPALRPARPVSPIPPAPAALTSGLDLTGQLQVIDLRT